MAWRTVRCHAAESALVGGGALDAGELARALQQLQSDINPGDTMGESCFHTLSETNANSINTHVVEGLW